MKILTRYILKEHLAPFIFAFFTITFLLIIDYVPRIIDQVLDKNLPWAVVIELVGLNLAWMLALSIPMSVLVATLMAFGRLTSDFEIIAIKASGINLMRVMVPLLIAAGMLTYGMIQFNDKILPDLNKRARTLWSDITTMRPTLVFRPGMFITDVPGYLILIDNVKHQTSEIEGVRITETKDPNKPRIIVATRGFLEVLDNGKYLKFTLFDGEIHSLDLQSPQEYRKVNFTNQIINIEGNQTGLVRTTSEHRTDREMNIASMQEKVNIALETIRPFRERIRNSVNTRLVSLFSDSVALPYDSLETDSAAIETLRIDALAMKQQIQRHVQQILSQEKVGDRYEVEIFKKYSIPAASVAFMLIGAPLGMLSRRGGMGVAIAISILLFIVYWAFLIGGEDLAERGIVSPFWAMWSANILLGLVGSYLLFILVTERPVFAFWRRKGNRS